jgi:hypothetical protein
MNILACSTTDDGTVKSVLSNYKFYAKKMIDNNVPNDNTNFLTNLPKKDFGEHFVSSTPSLCINGPELCLNVRYVNYKINEKGGYENQDKIHTINVVYTIDITKEKWCNTNDYVLEYNTELDKKYVGLEDVRIISSNNVLYYNANRGLDNETGHKMMVEHGIIVDKKTQSELLTIENQRNIEKNWVLFLVDNGLSGVQSYNTSLYKNKCMKIIYGWYPLTIGNIEGEMGSYEFKKTHIINTPPFFKHLRGSTNGVIIGDEIWFICHIVSYEERRYYYHMFVAIDAKTFGLKKYTPLFTFEQNPVEYTLGFIVNELNQIVIGYSVLDKTTKFITIPKKIIDNMF